MQVLNQEASAQGPRQSRKEDKQRTKAIQRKTRKDKAGAANPEPDRRPVLMALMTPQEAPSPRHSPGTARPTHRSTARHISSPFLRLFFSWIRFRCLIAVFFLSFFPPFFLISTFSTFFFLISTSLLICKTLRQNRRASTEEGGRRTDKQTRKGASDR